MPHAGLQYRNTAQTTLPVSPLLICSPINMFDYLLRIRHALSACMPETVVAAASTSATDFYGPTGVTP
jgi:hypothetical protein